MGPDLEVQGLLASACEKAGVVGAALAVRLGDRGAQAAFGRLDGSGESPVEPASRFRLGSVTKVITAAALERELDRAGIALDDPVSTVVAELASGPAFDRISFRHLLLHTSGIDGTFWDGFGDGSDAIVRYAAATSTLGSLFEPGSSWAYSNSGYVLAGRAIEVLGGLDFATALQERVIGPAGCPGVSVYEPVPPPGSANGHYASRQGPVPAEAPSGQRGLAPAGATAFASAGDTLELTARVLERQGADRLAAEAIPLATSEHDAATHQTLGWKMYRWAGTDCFGHDGGSTGQASFVRHIPERDAAIALLANTVPSAMYVWAKISRWFFDLVDVDVPGPIEPSPSARVDPADLGTYHCRDATFELSPGPDGTHRLAAHAPGGNVTTARLDALRPHLYRTDRPLVDAYGIISIERTRDDITLLHAGPFTARRDE
jgi:CubicO group peptidase (beta-lactamase class C family)